VPETKQVLVPDIGDFKDVPVIEVLVKTGDSIKAEDPLIVLESDKATIEVPSPFEGVVREISVKVGDKVSQGTLLLAMEVSEAEKAPAIPQPEPSGSPAPETASAIPSASSPIMSAAPAERNAAEAGSSVSSPAPQQPAQPAPPAAEPADAGLDIDEAAFAKAHASPSVRRFARELGVNLGAVKGTGPKERILREDLLAYVKTRLSVSSSPAGAGLDLLPWPRVNFAKFGPVESKPLSRIQKLSGANLHRNWVMIPHVTQFDEADITELESLRRESNESAQEGAVKVTILAFLMRASIAVLKKFPEFNASLDSESGEMNLVMKKYYHLGFAVDTPNGLMVPVIRDVDQKGVLAIGQEMAALAAQAREGRLKAADMQGASFTISSLGGIGGTAFTPIINAPEVAILGVSRASMKPVYQDGKFVPRLMLPLSLSYDHRVIDGATAARFTFMLGEVLADLRRVLL
jgi:pyruvate dehydrogenase E2 component (dihydrolipoamide acetyltransferase)